MKRAAALGTRSRRRVRPRFRAAGRRGGARTSRKPRRTVPQAGTPQARPEFGEVTIESVEVKAWPDAEDLAKAEKDPNDTKTMWIVFTYTSKAATDYKSKYAAAVLDPDGGKPWAEDDATRTLDKGKVADTNGSG